MAFQSVVNVAKRPKLQRYPSRFPDQPEHVTTDAEGRFRLNGLGRERIVKMRLSGPGMAFTDLWAMTRDGQHVQQNHTLIHPRKFQITADPGQIIKGVVRDRVSNKPLAGARILSTATTAQTTSDAEGRYELPGCRTDEAHTIWAIPAVDAMHFLSARTVPSQAGTGPVNFDLQLTPGRPLSGKVVGPDGQPVPGVVHYYPLSPNSHAGCKEMGCDLINQYRPPEVTLKADGTFTCPVLPGPGAILFSIKRPGFAAAYVDPRKVFSIPPGTSGFYGDDMVLNADGGGGGIQLGQTNYRAIELINSGENEVLKPVELRLKKARQVSGQLTDDRGQPLAGVRVRGLNHENESFGPALTEAAFTVVNLDGHRRRRLLFRHEEKKLLAVASTTGADDKPLDVRLQPEASAVGRLVDDGGKPQARLRVFFTPQKDPDGEDLFGLGATFADTGADGRFRATGLIPGVVYKVNVDARRLDGLDELQATPKPGEAIDYGSLRAVIRDPQP